MHETGIMDDLRHVPARAVTGINHTPRAPVFRDADMRRLQSRRLLGPQRSSHQNERAQTERRSLPYTEDSRHRLVSLRGQYWGCAHYTGTNCVIPTYCSNHTKFVGGGAGGIERYHNCRKNRENLISRRPSMAFNMVTSSVY